MNAIKKSQVSVKVLRIRKKMLEKGISQTALARDLLRSRQSIWLAFKGQRKSLLGKIAEYVEAR